MRPLLFIAVVVPLLSLDSSVPAWTAERGDGSMSAATVASEITTGDNIETGLISGRSAAAVGPAAPVVADGTPAPDREDWWW
jgi:hypothetical protein